MGACCDKLLPGTCCGKDINEIFSYEVAKTTRIKDARLAILQYVFMFFITMYIVIFQICYHNGYLSKLPVAGTVLWSVQSPALPTRWNAATHQWDTCCSASKEICSRDFPKIPYDPNCHGPPCDTTQSKCFRNFTSLATQGYCLQNGNGLTRVTDSGDTVKNFPCEFWDGSEAGIGSKNSMFLTTHVSTDWQIAHISPQTAPAGFKTKENTNLTGGVVLQQISLTSTDTSLGLCDASCDANANCTGWTIEASQCNLLSNPSPDDNGFISLVPVAATGVTAGLKEGAATARTPGCGCKNNSDITTCSITDTVDGYGRVPGGVYKASDGPRELTYKCDALFHTRNHSKLKNETQPDDRFIADIEQFTVSINHNVEQSTFGYKASAQSMKGWLQVDANTPAANALCHDDPTAVDVYDSSSPFGFNGTGGSTNTAPCMILPKQDRDNCDYFPLKTLLDAAGIELDSISQGTTHSVRYRGSKLIVFIQYMNSVPFRGLADDSEDNNGGITYIYKLQPLNSETLVQEMTWTNYPLERMLFKRAGVLITAVQTGEVAKFDFSTLLLTITTSLTFLTVAGIIVRIIATKLIGEKEYYESVMVDESAAYTVLKERRHLFNMSEDELRAKCGDLGLPTTGDHKALLDQLIEHGGEDLDTPLYHSAMGDNLVLTNVATDAGGPLNAADTKELLEVVDNLETKIKMMEEVLVNKGLMVKSEGCLVG